MAKRDRNIGQLMADLRKEAQQPSLKDDLRDLIAKGLDPDSKRKGSRAPYAEYAEDPVGFAYDVLKIEFLTEDQEAFMRAVAQYGRVVAMSATGTGKTYALSILILWFFYCRFKPQVWMFAAPPEDNLKLLLWGEIRERIEERPELFEDVLVRASMYIERSAKEFIQGVSIPRSASNEDIVSSFSGKHAPSIMFIGDEADAVPDAVFEGVDGCLSGGFPRLVVCLNPKKKTGFVYDQISKGLAYTVSMSAFNHPNVITGEDVVPGAVTREKTIERIHDLCEPLPLGDEPDEWCFELPEYLENVVVMSGSGQPYPPLQGGMYRVIDGTFMTKVLGLYPPAGENQLIHESWIDAAVSKWELMRKARGGDVTPPEGIRPDMSLDVAGGGPNNNVAMFRYGDWYDLPVVWPGVDADMAAEEAAKLYIERNAKKALVDASGVGNGVAPKMTRIARRADMQKLAKEHGINLTMINAVGVDTGEAASGWNEEGRFHSRRDEGYWALRLAFKDGNIMIPPDTRSHACKRLHDALKKLTYTEEAGVIKIVKKRVLISQMGGESPDEADALMLQHLPPSTWFGGV